MLPPPLKDAVPAIASIGGFFGGITIETVNGYLAAASFLVGIASGIITLRRQLRKKQ